MRELVLHTPVNIANAYEELAESVVRKLAMQEYNMHQRCLKTSHTAVMKCIAIMNVIR